MISREFCVGYPSVVALIGALISEIRFRDSRDGGLDVAAVTRPSLPPHDSSVTGPGPGRHRVAARVGARLCLHRAGRQLNRLVDGPASRSRAARPRFLRQTCI